jgi:hypothetical protein
MLLDLQFDCAKNLRALLWYYIKVCDKNNEL